jgi:hypothetical protein
MPLKPFKSINYTKNKTLVFYGFAQRSFLITLVYQAQRPSPLEGGQGDDSVKYDVTLLKIKIL